MCYILLINTDAKISGLIEKAFSKTIFSVVPVFSFLDSYFYIHVRKVSFKPQYSRKYGAENHVALRSEKHISLLTHVITWKLNRLFYSGLMSLKIVFQCATCVFQHVKPMEKYIFSVIKATVSFFILSLI